MSVTLAESGELSRKLAVTSTYTSAQSRLCAGSIRCNQDKNIWDEDAGRDLGLNGATQSRSPHLGLN